MEKKTKIIKAPAKINLGLHLLRKRMDGYHDLATVFIAINWFDTIRLSPADASFMTCSQVSLPIDQNNLCLKALNALQAYTDKPLNFQLDLTKNIPFGAGLGGGSSDAASVLLALNNLRSLGLAKHELHALAKKLGADVPFFLEKKPVYALGIGTELTFLETYQFPFYLVVAMPKGVQVPTAAAYQMIRPNDQNRPYLPDLVRSNDLDWWKKELINDFEAPIMAKYPMIHTLKQTLMGLGAGYVAMSGSGAAVFGVFEQEAQATAAAAALQTQTAAIWYGTAWQELKDGEDS